ncbi:hypothetical protein CEXT_527481 [Caerostris extrusa]|uniref:Uncharacterized protein n=1 Tax=Caerostris extrusa TaxID=172846 RepID=A0AAV4RYM5_CAEEX|nr:hypothetical protein CEXT_527481 [Caerostris extrusa]
MAVASRRTGHQGQESGNNSQQKLNPVVGTAPDGSPMLREAQGLPGVAHGVPPEGSHLHGGRHPGREVDTFMFEVQPIGSLAFTNVSIHSLYINYWILVVSYDDKALEVNYNNILIIITRILYIS